MDQIEAFHLNWLRFILTVNRRTPKDAVRGEFGRFPVYIEQLKHMLNYWFKLSGKHRNSILYNSFKVHQTLGLNHKPSVFLMLRKYFDSVSCNMPENIPELANRRNVNRILVQQLCDVFISRWYNRLHNDCRTKSSRKNKLRTNRIFKTQFEFELYLQCVKQC